MNRILLSLALLLSSAVSWSGTAWSAPTLGQLVDEGHIELSVGIDKKETVSVGEQVILNIDVATDTWFTKGTKIARFEIENALVLQQSPTVINSSVRKHGKPYSHQRWEFPLFPQKSGDYVIPPIVVEVTIKHDKGSISGKLLTKPTRFKAHIPSPYMNDDSPWLVGENVTLAQNIVVKSASEDKQPEQLYVGDSVERSVTVKGQSTSSMLMPDLLDEQHYQSDNVRVYPDIAQRSDRSVRGVSSSTHQEKITVIATQPGVIEIPEIKLLWWNPKTGQEEFLTLEGQTWRVSHTPLSFIKFYWAWLVTGAVLATGLALLLRRVYLHLKHLSETDSLPLWFQFWQSIVHRHYGKSETVLYRKIQRDNGEYQLKNHKETKKWQIDVCSFQRAKYSTQYSTKETQNSTSPNIGRKLKRLWTNADK